MEKRIIICVFLILVLIVPQTAISIDKQKASVISKLNEKKDMPDLCIINITKHIEYDRELNRHPYWIVNCVNQGNAPTYDWVDTTLKIEGFFTKRPIEFDTLHGTSGPIEPEEKKSFRLKEPCLLLPGLYHVTVTIDYKNRNDESNEENNVWHIIAFISLFGAKILKINEEWAFNQH